MISIQNLTKSYKKAKAVNNISLSIKNGTMFGFLGPNGAGKTTAMKIIVGLLAPTKGEVKIDDHKIESKKSRENIGFMPEDPYFYDHLTALEFMNYMASFFDMRSCNSERPLCHPERSEGSSEQSERAASPRFFATAQNDNIKRLLNLVGLKDAMNKKISKFSKGMKQRLGLAQALINDPEYLFLDEPLDGLDPIGRREFKQILLSLKKKKKTIFFNSHILSDVEEICDQIGVIDKGKLIYSGPVKKFRGNKSLEDAFVEKLT